MIIIKVKYYIKLFSKKINYKKKNYMQFAEHLDYRNQMKLLRNLVFLKLCFVLLTVNCRKLEGEGTFKLNKVDEY